MLQLGYLLFIIFVASSVAKYTDRSIISMYVSSDGTLTDEVCESTQVSCEDCNTVSVCVQQMHKMTIKCENANPFCRDGGCSPESSNNCSAAISKFDCSNLEGTFPDPEDCKLYHMCINNTGFDYRCEIPNTVYSPVTKSCVLKTLKNKCVTVTCKQNGARVPYPSDPSMYFTCVQNQPVFLRLCPEGSAFDENTQLCEAKCTQEGNIPDPQNEKKFVECISEIVGTTRYKQNLRTCPESDTVKSVFDPHKKECVVDTSE